MIKNTENIEALLNRVSKLDDQKSFEELFDMYYSWLYSISLDIVNKKEVAEEVVEDIFFDLWQKRKSNNAIKNLSTYLYVATKNRSYSQFKKLSKVENTDLEEVAHLPDYLANPEQNYLTSELQGMINDAVDDLPPKCQEVFRLVRIEGLSYKKTAEILNISPKTVENQLSIAIKKISHQLTPYLSELEQSKHSA